MTPAIDLTVNNRFYRLIKIRAIVLKTRIEMSQHEKKIHDVI